MSELQSSPPFDASLSPDLLIRAVQDISTATSLETIAAILLRTAHSGTAAARVVFSLREGDRCRYVDDESDARPAPAPPIPLQECFAGWVMQHGQPAVIPDLALDERTSQDRGQPAGMRSAVVVPVRSPAPLGALGVYWPEIREAPLALVAWLQALADASSAGIEAVRAQGEVAALRRHGSNHPHGDAPREFVRMCAWTRRVFHEGQWISIEAYLRSCHGVYVTHGMSEEALERLRQDIAKL